MPVAGLVAVMDFAALAADEFHDWYDLEHLPERLRIPGFLGGERWIDATDSKIHIGTYDLDGLAVLQSPPYRAIAGDNASPWAKRVMGKCRRIARVAGDQIVPGGERAPSEGAGGLLFVAMNVVAEAEDEFNTWYDTEHLPMLNEIDGTLSARCFKAADGFSHRYFATYHLTGPDVAESAPGNRSTRHPGRRSSSPISAISCELPPGVTRGVEG